MYQILIYKCLEINFKVCIIQYIVLVIICQPILPVICSLFIERQINNFVGVLVIPGLRDYFDLPLPDARDIASAIGIGVIGAAAIEIGWRMTDWSIPEQATND